MHSAENATAEDLIEPLFNQLDTFFICEMCVQLVAFGVKSQVVIIWFIVVTSIDSSMLSA